MKKIIYCLVGLISVLSMHSCASDPNSPGVEYMPDMYQSPAVELYGEHTTPPEGTISVHQRDVDVEALLLDSNAIAEGQELYEIHCIVCHGPEGKGDGSVPSTGKYPPPPAYSNLSSEHIYEIATNGKNAMGSYEYQLDDEERWKVVAYIQTLQSSDD